ncbi:MAG: phosphotransferase family protein [Hyphomicrobiaceae bacterium]
MPETPATFRPEETTIRQDWAALSRHLAGHGFKFEPVPAPQQFAGGFGNLNYLVSIDGKPWVLRRPPMGPIPPGANDMAREYKVLSAIAPAFPLAPKALYFTADPAMLGAPFLILEYRPGLVIRELLPTGLNSNIAGPQLSQLLVDILARLHGIDPVSVGLGEFGKPDGFLNRAVEGWAKRAEIAGDGKVASAGRTVIEWLRAAPVPKGDVTLLHNDFKLDNVILDTDTLVPRAVVDWDMGSRGDPLFDLATMLSYWTQSNDPPCMHEVRQMPTAMPGFMTRAEVVEAYARLSGRDVSQFRFHRILTMFKTSIVYLQLGAQWRRGATNDPRFERFTQLGTDLLDFTHEITQNRAN